MDGGNEQRTFCFTAGLSETETLVLVQKTYGNEALNRSNVFRLYAWISRQWQRQSLGWVTIFDSRKRQKFFRPWAASQPHCHSPLLLLQHIGPILGPWLCRYRRFGQMSVYEVGMSAPRPTPNLEGLAPNSKPVRYGCLHQQSGHHLHSISHSAFIFRVEQFKPGTHYPHVTWAHIKLKFYFQLLPYPFPCVGSHMLISIIRWLGVI